MGVGVRIGVRKYVVLFWRKTGMIDLFKWPREDKFPACRTASKIENLLVRWSER